LQKAIQDLDELFKKYNDLYKEELEKIDRYKVSCECSSEEMTICGS